MIRWTINVLSTYGIFLHLSKRKYEYYRAAISMHVLPAVN